jgi:hypothetical protein
VVGAQGRGISGGRRDTIAKSNPHGQNGGRREVIGGKHNVAEQRGLPEITADIASARTDQAVYAPLG